MHRLQLSRGSNLSYEIHGSGPPLVLVHGAFSDHRTNWEFVLPQLSAQFTVYAVARPGRGETAAAEERSLLDESADVAALIETIPDPVFLLGHSYGAHVALAVASMMPGRVRKLVLYEAPWPDRMRGDVPAKLKQYANAGDWDGLSWWFFANVLSVPVEDLESLRSSELWEPIVSDAKASLADILALSTYDFRPERFRELTMPVLLQIGTESPRDLYVTDGLLEVLPKARLEAFQHHAHEAMTTAPRQYATAVLNFLATDLP